MREAEVNSYRPSPDVSDHDQVKLDDMTPGWIASTGPKTATGRQQRSGENVARGGNI